MDLLKVLLTFALIVSLKLAWYEHQYHVETAEVQPNPYVGVASDGFKRAMEYHGIKSAHWDWEKGTWVFKRNGEVCILKTGVGNGRLSVLKKKVRKPKLITAFKNRNKEP